MNLAINNMLRRVLLSGLFIVILSACSRQTPDYPQRQMPADIGQSEQEITWANETFLDKCAYCHGHENEGRGERADFFDPPAPDFHERKYRSIDPAYLFWRISEGKTVEPYLSRGSVMPAWGPHFTDRETWLMVDFIRRRAASRAR